MVQSLTGAAVITRSSKCWAWISSRGKPARKKPSALFLSSVMCRTTRSTTKSCGTSSPCRIIRPIIFVNSSLLSLFLSRLQSRRPELTSFQPGNSERQFSIRLPLELPGPPTMYSTLGLSLRSSSICGLSADSSESLARSAF